MFTSIVMVVATGREAELAAAAAIDLDGAFPAIVERYGRVVYSTARRLSVQAVDAEDLAAEAFARAYAAMRAQPAERTAALRLRPWLITITLNLWRNQLRDASRRPVTAPLAAVNDPPAPGADPAERREGDPRLVCALSQLPEAQRVAVILRHVVGLRTSEVADALSCPAGTAKSHVFRGLAALRAALVEAREGTS